MDVRVEFECDVDGREVVVVKLGVEIEWVMILVWVGVDWEVIVRDGGIFLDFVIFFICIVVLFFLYVVLNFFINFLFFIFILDILLVLFVFLFYIKFSIFLMVEGGFFIGGL